MQFSCDIRSSAYHSPLGLEIWIDDHCLLDLAAVETAYQFQRECELSDGEHQLRIVLKNKTPQHTCLDADGRMIQDATVTVSNIMFDQVNIDHVMTRQARYSHDFNGSGPRTEQAFHATLGCNGTVSLDFATPVYTWLLYNI